MCCQVSCLSRYGGILHTTSLQVGLILLTSFQTFVSCQYRTVSRIPKVRLQAYPVTQRGKITYT
ncbi:hypothetical protein DL95DRAFT_383281 [Leptodontidium sp. 2 PMI_412]|nr:hypothetical protein DL95DRAFT_383281 [Leptodontidium sp. 2 PMI_412]